MHKVGFVCINRLGKFRAGLLLVLKSVIVIFNQPFTLRRLFCCCQVFTDYPGTRLPNEHQSSSANVASKFAKDLPTSAEPTNYGSWRKPYEAYRGRRNVSIQGNTIKRSRVFRGTNCGYKGLLCLQCMQRFGSESALARHVERKHATL